MGLFRKKGSDSSNDDKGNDLPKRGIVDRVKQQRVVNELVSKYPWDDIRKSSVVIVGPNQVGVLVMDGQVAERYGPGKHKVDSANFPVIHRLLTVATAGQSVNTAEVWLVSTVERRNMPWGFTDVGFRDPFYNIRITLGGNGNYGIKIKDPEAFLFSIDLDLDGDTFDRVLEQFDSDIRQTISSNLHGYMKENNLSIDDMASGYVDLARICSTKLDSVFSEYGLELRNFRINTIIPRHDKHYDDLMAAYTEGARLDRISNDKYTTARMLDNIGKAAENEGAAGGTIGAGLGAGMGFGMGNMMGNMMGGQQQQQPGQQQPPQQQNPSGPPPAPGTGPAGAPPPPVAAEIYMSVSGQTYGPYNMDQLKEYKQQGSLTKDTLVWKTGMGSWVAASAMPELQSLFGSGPAAPPPPPPPA